ncbi:MAG: NADH-quinone oxidoreductase subunit L, partial [Candidatus Eremiobacterota bacterium]
LGGAICLTLGRHIGRASTGWLASGAVGAAFLCSLLTALNPPAQPDQVLFQWLRLGEVAVPFGAWVDPLSLTMLLTVTGVAFLIHLYSIGYMAEEPDFGRFFGYLNLFVATMVMLVLADNFAVLLIGWAGVGFASCMLIGFHSERPAALTAARKAFILNTFGDLGLMLAVFLLAQGGSVSYAEVLAGQHVPAATLVCVGLLVAAYAKSAQFPLHTWLPDAMEGPTPVSALIHAATMVTAGVYLVVRCEPLFAAAPEVQVWVAALGLVSAAMAATCAVAQTDLKRVLAYSTMSQLGYMFMAAGVGASAAAIFHLVTHAFFKALLFLCAGTVIHGLHGEQNMLRMGGLRQAASLRTARWGFLVGGLALAGFPLLAGFFSKEAILAAIEAGGITRSLWLGAVLTSALTAFYIGRAYFLVFLSRPTHEHSDLHAPAAAMEAPVWVLLVLSAGAGAVLGQPGGDLLPHYLGATEGRLDMAHGVGLALATALPGLAAAWMMAPPGQPPVPFTAGLYRFLAAGWGMDFLQNLFLAGPIRLISNVLGGPVEQAASSAVPDSLGKVAFQSGTELGLSQTGFLRNYAFVLLLAVLAVLCYALATAGRGA